MTINNGGNTIAFMSFKDEVKSLYKSKDTEDLLDRFFNNPIGYLFAKIFIKLNWSPNAITVLSMAVGMAGGILFASTSLKKNIIGMILVVLSIALDATDGQVARFTNKKSELGRVLDGIASGVVFGSIYVALMFRLFNEPIPFIGRPWGIWIVVLAFASGLLGMQKQCMFADYYRNIHLLFQKSTYGSELESSETIKNEKANLPKGSWFKYLYLSFYYSYTRSQEKGTLAFQWLYKEIKESNGVPSDERKDIF
ncbi:MAG: CDP-alcohol phosphatidyltransferase family protein, partial [Sphaerochaetaceae bacterium]|nr:CDP-alcohol phosphatidyltransferase family protein [Sphaerochaetaceae bacterium]